MLTDRPQGACRLFTARVVYLPDSEAGPDVRTTARGQCSLPCSSLGPYCTSRKKVIVRYYSEYTCGIAWYTQMTSFVALYKGKLNSCTAALDTFTR